MILDEIGRGTATFDGLSIAYACVEHLNAVNRSRALFATHFHELTQLAETLPRLINLTMRVSEFKGSLVFLHEVVPGAADRSYGIQVAKLAGLPASVVKRARKVLADLEASRPSGALDALPLFSYEPHEPPTRARDDLRAALAALDPDAMTPARGARGALRAEAADRRTRRDHDRSPEISRWRRFARRAYLYVVTPGPAFLALFTLAASRGRVSGAWFICGHLVGDVTWGALAVAAIVGANRIGPTLFEAARLRLRALSHLSRRPRGDDPQGRAAAHHRRRAGRSRPAWPSASPIPSPIRWRWRCSRRSSRPISARSKLADAPQMFVAAFSGFLLADATLIFAAGLPAVRRFFLTHGVAVTRVVGVIFILFGARSIADAAGGAMRRTA